MRSRKRLVGPVSLAVMIVGLVVTELLIRLGVLSSPWWRVLAGGFEAGTIGGLADWYAVHVLFHPAPWPLSWIPLFRRHSNLVVRNRPQLSRNIAHTVQTEWLSPESVQEYLRKVRFAELLVDYLGRAQSRAAAVDFIRRAVLTPLARQLDEPALAEAIQTRLRDVPSATPARWVGRAMQSLLSGPGVDRAWDAGLAAAQKAVRSPRAGEVFARLIRRLARLHLPALVSRLRGGPAAQSLAERIRDRLADPRLAGRVGRLLGDAVRGGRHDPLIRAILSDVRKMVATDPAVRRNLAQWLDNAVTLYKRNLSGPRRVFAALLEVLALNREEAVEAMRSAILKLIDDFAAGGDDSLRSRLDIYLERWADKLSEGRPEAAAAFDSFRRRVVDVLDWPGLIGTVLDLAADTLDRELREEADAASTPDANESRASRPGPGSAAVQFRLLDIDALSQSLARLLDGVLEESRGQPDNALRRRVTDWLASWSARLAEGDAEAVRAFDSIRAEVLAGPDIGKAIHVALAAAKNAVLAQVAGNESTVMRLVDRLVDSSLAELRGDPAARQRFDAFVRDRLIRLEAEHHQLIGQMVQASLDRLSDERLVEQIDRRVGDDLQFIRLNGAVLGFLIGVALFAGWSVVGRWWW